MQLGDNSLGFMSYKGIPSSYYWQQIGNTKTGVGGGGTPAICALTSNRIVFGESFNDDYLIYDFDGSTWTLFGGLYLSNLAAPSLAAMSATRFAAFDATSDLLRAFDISGTTAVQVGSGLSIPTSGEQAMCKMTPTRVAFVDSGSGKLSAYDFNGSTWSLVGAQYSPGANYCSMARLSDTDIAFISNSGDVLKCLRFNGSAWSQVGNTLSIILSGRTAMCAFSSTRIVLVDPANLSVKVYDFNGTNWSQVGPTLTVSDMNVNGQAVCALSDNRIALIGYTTAAIRVFDFLPIY